MARTAQAKALRKEKREAKEKMFAKLEVAARAKFDTFKQLNKAIDAKVTADMTPAEKLKLSNLRTSSATLKRELVAQQTHILIENVGVGSCKGMWDEKGGTKVARGKEKIKKSGKAPSKIQFGKGK